MKTFLAILLLTLTGFAFADGHLEAEEGDHAEMAPPAESEGELGSEERENCNDIDEEAEGHTGSLDQFYECLDMRIHRKDIDKI